jgi:hypothetical protein
MKKYIIASLVLLSACSGDVKGDLGLRKEGPDEFAVERKPKLEVPPSFKLRPPAPGEAPLNVEKTSDTAREALINSDTTFTESEKSAGEDALLNKAGADAANPEIKDIIKQEYQEDQEKDILERLESISEDNREKTLVDPEKERERIVNNKKENKPITEGETPAKSINDDKTVIDKIFN